MRIKLLTTHYNVMRPHKRGSLLVRQWLVPLGGKIPTNSGFTLLELLVVFTLGIFISGVGIVAFAAYGRSQILTNAATQTKLFIQEVRFTALSSVIPPKASDGSTIDCGSSGLLGYKVQIVSAQKQVRSYLLCGNQTSYLVKQVKFPSNISIDSTTTCDQIQFDALSAQAAGANCNVIIQGYGAKKNIFVDAGGNVKITNQ